MEQLVNAAVLFADVSGSTQLYESAGDVAAAAAIDDCVALFRRCTDSMGGRVIKTIGDEVMASFPSADSCTHAAIAMQLGIAALPPISGAFLGVRIGFQAGAVVEKDGDVFGDTVNLAARLTELAQRGQIITSQETMEALSPSLRIACRQLYSMQIKGKEQEVALCEVIWRESDEKTALVGAWSGAPQAVEAKTSLRLKYGTTEIVLDESRKSLLLGRDKSAEMVIADSMASRAHCKIEQRRDKFVLSDYSANGTYISVDGDREIMLRREEFTLRGRGSITFGQQRSHTKEIVEFSCETQGVIAQTAAAAPAPPPQNSVHVSVLAEALQPPPAIPVTQPPVQAAFGGHVPIENSTPTGHPPRFTNSSLHTRAPTELPRFDPATLAEAEKALAKYLGALARIVVKRAAAKAIDAQELYLLLADEIEVPEEKKAFIRAYAGSGRF